VIVIGMLVLAAALAWYTQIPVDGHFWPDLLPAYIVFALGLAFAFVPVSIAAFLQVQSHEAGLASGLLNTSQQVGGAIGVAVAATIFTTQAKSQLKTGESVGAAFTSGYQHAFWALLAIALAGAVAAFVLLRGTTAQVVEAEAAQAPA
jgi:asparagine N-glycosylation enzyme membrane subunit Stt3